MNPKLLLRLGPAMVMIIFGLHQLTSPDYWYKFVPQWLPVDHQSFMRLHALGNIALGVWLLSGVKLYWSTFVALIWFLTISSVALTVQWDIGVRDLAISSGLAGLLLLAR